MMRKEKRFIGILLHTLWHMQSSRCIRKQKFGVGPAIENGFYYDFDINKKLDDEDLRKIEEKMEKISKKIISLREPSCRSKAVDFFKIRMIV